MQTNIDINAASVLIAFICTGAALFLAAYFALRRRLVLAALCLVCFFALFNPSVAMSAELCKPIQYADGDTFTFKRGNETVRVRLAGYDAVERGQPFSNRATDRLRELTEGGAQCDCYKQDKYGRSVCTVRMKSGINVATEMLKAGYACIDPRFESEAAPEDRAAARAALKEAQTQRRGMWSLPDPVCAVDFRRTKNAQ
jgi:endonuclease YncB( thermonuclease family)